jgi:uncharacterized repeat protein (TIGR03803 family)
MTHNHKKLASAFTLPIIALAALALASIQPAKAQTLTPLHDFVQYPTGDGLAPQAGLVRDAYGNLYGTTFYGGAHGFTSAGYYSYGPGTVFKVTPSGTENLVYSFGAMVNASGGGYADGAFPASDLVIDREGNLYGTTEMGGSNNMGTVFKITKSGVETVLHNFACTDGAFPIGGLVMEGKDLYGTASEGGANATCATTVTGNGVLFKLSLGRSVSYSVLHNFIGSPYDVSYPTGTLLLDQGNLYGIAEGGKNGSGSIFRFTTGKKPTLTLLYNFYSGVAVGSGRLLQDSHGNLYGTTIGEVSANEGTVFKLQPDGQFITLHTFMYTNYDGYYPTGGLVMDKAGNLFGTTFNGGLDQFGTLFEITRDGKESVLYNFGDDNFGNALWPGQHPNGDLIMDGKGNIYGTCQGYVPKIPEVGDWGTVFKFGPNL